MSIVSELLITYFKSGRKTKTTPSGWISGNAPCCTYNGESQDTKQRGGLVENNEGVSYHCFNCGFKASWQPGRTINYKMRQLMRWLNIPDTEINKISLEVLRLNEGIEGQSNINSSIILPTFQTVKFPEHTIKITENNVTDNVTNDYTDVLNYIKKRNLVIGEKYNYYWCNNPVYKRRMIIPFYYNQQLVGWTARIINSDKNPRYLLETQPGFVYGLDQQTYQRNFCIVTEGPIDANHVEGVAIMGSEISKQQALLINRLNKDVIVVPDRDSKGKAFAEQAIELGWQVSMPDWKSDIKDTNDAVSEYGRLYTLYSIVTAAESSSLKIKLRMKKWFG